MKGFGGRNEERVCILRAVLVYLLCDCMRHVLWCGTAQSAMLRSQSFTARSAVTRSVHLPDERLKQFAHRVAYHVCKI